MLRQRGAGVLMHISSLPSPYGIGVFDRHARDFIDRIADMGFTYWQVLPFNPIDGAGSPYCSPSAFAGNYLFIDPQGLQDMGLVTAEEVAANHYDGTPYTADFAFAAERRLALLEQAFLRIDDTLAAKIKAFEVENPWLTDYSVFMAVKEAEGGKPWWQWSDRHAHYHTCIQDIFSYESRAAFWKFVQYIFYLQWGNIKAYANEKGVAVLGDMPIYVAMDSADVWSGLPLFLIDEKTLKPEKVAGVPPDYFSENGQLWGNPLYDWAYHKKTGYAWWIQRVRHALGIYDLLRIDHFRGFDTYWAIPATSTTARTGKWENGPGMELFDALEAALGKLPIIAEDLGELFPSVRKLLADSTFPGMKVLQFAFSGGDSEYLPHNHVKNSVVYPGTHDNTTLTDWWENGASEKEKATAAAYLHLTPCKPTAKEVAAVKTAAARTALLRAALGSVADRAIIPMYDWLGLGAEAHLNTPGKLGGNWAWRAKAGFDSKALAAQIEAECAVYCRCNADVQNVKESAI